MNRFSLFICFLSALSGGCITTSLPQIAIPERTNKADFSVAFVNTSAHLNAMYTSKPGIAILAGLGTNGFTSHGELGLGFVRPKNLLISVGLGNASYTARPLTYGGTNDVMEYWGRFSSVSIRVNKQLKQGAGIINSILFVRGTDNGDCAHNCYKFTNRPLEAIYYEPVFYVRGHRNRYRYFILSGSIKIKAPEDVRERMFDFVPLHVGYGFNFPRPKQKS